MRRCTRTPSQARIRGYGAATRKGRKLSLPPLGSPTRRPTKTDRSRRSAPGRSRRRPAGRCHRPGPTRSRSGAEASHSAKHPDSRTASTSHTEGSHRTTTLWHTSRSDSDRPARDSVGPTGSLGDSSRDHSADARGHDRDTVHTRGDGRRDPSRRDPNRHDCPNDRCRGRDDRPCRGPGPPPDCHPGSSRRDCCCRDSSRSDRGCYRPRGSSRFRLHCSEAVEVEVEVGVGLRLGSTRHRSRQDDYPDRRDSSCSRPAAVAVEVAPAVEVADDLRPGSNRPDRRDRHDHRPASRRDHLDRRADRHRAARAGPAAVGRPPPRRRRPPQPRPQSAKAASRS